MPASARHLLIVANQPSPNTTKLAETAEAGARAAAESLPVLRRAPLDASADDVLGAAGILIGSTENFGAMAGLVKDFFERIYYPCLEHTQGLPAGLYVRAGNDGNGTLKGIDRIMTGLRWQNVREPLLLRGDWNDAFVDEVHELGQLMAAGLEAGIF
ncbi:MAG: flavodoxin [Gammaproteobacteria bacterium]|nr:MAG: flavodoxin [Gammaproteobacteria bacterium]PIE36637.1 MAG: flavodoxin [Gammaproteobacteria bacterium]